MSTHSGTDLGSGSVGKLLFSLALPTITSQIVNMLYNLVDRVYIGHMQPTDTVGKLALTGVGVCLPIIMVISAFAALLAMGGAPRASIEEGRGNSGEAERIMGNCFAMLVIVSLVLTVVFRVFARPMLMTFGASENTIGYALERLRFPSKLVFLFLFTYRYLHVIADEWHKLHGAARLRGFAPKTNMHTYRTFGNMLGMVFVHSFDRSVRVYEAMILRGFSGRFQSVTAFRATSRDAVFAVAAFACMVCLVAFDLYLEFPRG